MAAGSDNIFPKLITAVQATDPSAPANGDWKTYSKVGGIYARSSNSIVGPFAAAATVETIGTFTPTWGSAGSAPTLGNGTVVGFYQKIADKLYWFSILFTYGSTSAPGTGAYNFGNLPFTVKSTSPAEQTVVAQLRDAGTTRYTGSAQLVAGGTAVGGVYIAEATGARAWATTVPITLATGDTCAVEGVVATN